MRTFPAFLFCAAMAFAQHPDLAGGRKLFRSACSACHGDNAKGGRGPDLTTGEWKHGGSDEDLTRNITKGIAGTQMPAIPLPEADTRQIIAFLRSLQAQAEVVPGDAEAGHSVFTAQCAGCHMFAGTGGRFATDLTRIRNRQKASAVKQSMSEAVSLIEVRTKAGAVVRGARKQEDTFSLLLMDASEKIHSFWKRDVVLSKKEQAHPKLSPSDTDNALAFLMKYDASKIAPSPWKPSADLNVTFDRLRDAAKEPWNWLTYWGDFAGRHASALKQITVDNVNRLRNDWTYQFGGNTVETMPL
ncbi:MAG: c-type cytochrome, partial [Bryobacterales bacterium]|nr:c-type cytochrome [Bryobacterales bacterium]